MENYQQSCHYCDNQIKEENKEEDLSKDFEKLDLMKRAIKPSIINPLKERFAIAPMVDVTDNYFRYFCRFLTKHSFLYTEMLNEHAIIHMDK